MYVSNSISNKSEIAFEKLYYLLLYAYTCMVEKVLFLDAILEIEFLVDLPVLSTLNLKIKFLVLSLSLCVLHRDSTSNFLEYQTKNLNGQIALIIVIQDQTKEFGYTRSCGWKVLEYHLCTETYKEIQIQYGLWIEFLLSTF